MDLPRRKFLVLATGAVIVAAFKTRTPIIMTVSGPIKANELGIALVHEHFLVDFIGADKTNYNRWNRTKVVEKVLPYLEEIKQFGVRTIFDCTPAYLGRDVELLKMLTDKSGLQIVTNTGYYGAVDNKYLPPHVWTETAEQLSKRWITEFERGIEESRVKPGFIKIGVNPGSLSPLHKKLVTAAALTHLATGLTICSHTGEAPAALEQIQLLKENGVDPSAFVWVHAQAEKEERFHQQAGALNGWISLDGVGWGDFESHANLIVKLKRDGLLHRVLVSHDAGWYKPDEPLAKFIGYANLFTKLVPLLKNDGFSNRDITQLLEKNPMDAFSIRVRKI